MLAHLPGQLAVELPNYLPDVWKRHLMAEQKAALTAHYGSSGQDPSGQSSFSIEGINLPLKDWEPWLSVLTIFMSPFATYPWIELESYQQGCLKKACHFPAAAYLQRIVDCNKGDGSIRCPVSFRRKAMFFCLMGLVAWLSVGGVPLAGAAMQDSTLVSNVITNQISGTTFANLMASYLISGGQANCLDSIFLFQECYGGGMVNDLYNALGTTVPWEAGSASASDLTSNGQMTVNEAARVNLSYPPKHPLYDVVDVPNLAVNNAPVDFWTSQLTKYLPTDATVQGAIYDAQDFDPYPPELPMEGHANGGENIVLADPNAKNYDAIIWAGNPNRTRYSNSVSAMYNTLANAWKGKKYTIDVLYNDGTKFSGVPLPTLPGGTPLYAASLGTLNLAMKSFNLTNKSEFVFYATDHGGTVVPVKTAPSKVDKNSPDVEDFSLDPNSVADIDDDTYTGESDDSGLGLSFNPYAPYVEVDYDSVDADNTAAVYAGSDFLGYLPSADTSIDFNIPYGDVGASDEISVVDNGDPFNLDGESFYGGAEAGDLPPEDVPEPSGKVLIGAAPALLLCCRRRRPFHSDCN